MDNTWRAVKLNLDMSYTVFDLGPYPDLPRQINPTEDVTFGLAFLNGPLDLHPGHVTVGIAVDEDGYMKRLPINKLACSLHGAFVLRAEPLVGTAIVVGSDWRGDIADVPDWVINLIRELKRAVDIGFKYHQNVDYN